MIISRSELKDFHTFPLRANAFDIPHEALLHKIVLGMMRSKENKKPLNNFHCEELFSPTNRKKYFG